VPDAVEASGHPMTERLRFLRDTRSRLATFTDLHRLYGPLCAGL